MKTRKEKIVLTSLLVIAAMFIAASIAMGAVAIDVQGTTDQQVTAYRCVLVGGELTATSSAATMDLYDLPDNTSVHDNYLISHVEVAANLTIYPDYRRIVITNMLYVTTTNDEHAFVYIE